MPVRASGDEQVIPLCQCKQARTLVLGITAMPYLKTVKPLIGEARNLFVGKQHAIAARISRMCDHRDTAGTLHRTHHLACGWRRRGYVVFAVRAHCIGERLVAVRVHAGGHERVGDVRASDCRARALLGLFEHALPGNRIILGKQCDHLLRALHTRAPCLLEQVAYMPVAWIVQVREHVHGDIAILRGDFRTAHQRQMEVV